jgi:23S rRNA (guanosine2251-2'-O)-methyltransferase
LKNTVENKPRRKSEFKPKGKPEGKSEFKPKGKPEGKSEFKPKGKPEGKSEGKPEFKSNRKSEFKPERRPEFKPERRPEFRPERNEETESENSGIIIGRNAVIEALKADREIEKILVSGTGEGSIKKIIAMASDKKIPIHFSDKVTLDRAADGENHQGVVASVSAAPNAEIEDILAHATSRGEDPFIIILDGIEDPHNLGAIIRTAECAGAHGVVIPKRRAAGITEVVSKTSAGAIEYMRCARVANIAQTIDKLKSHGVWIAACDMYGDTLYDANLKGPIAIVIGGEGNGIGKLVKEKCDFAISIPMKGQIGSLNASNAAAVVLYEVRRQRDGK